MEAQNQRVQFIDARKKYPQWVAGRQHGETLKETELCHHGQINTPAWLSHSGLVVW